MHPFFQHYLPQQLLSRFVGLLANSKIDLIKNLLIKYFTKLYPVNMTEAEIEDPYAYKTFNQFFTRKLKPSLRLIVPAINALASPCDGTIYQRGNIEDCCLLQAKGSLFTIQDLLGAKINHNVFNNGAFINIYLSPTDYHRVHMPVTGTLQQMDYIPGKLFSVNNTTVKYIPNLFARNERVVNIFQTEFGTIAIILVGAMLVGSIKTTWAGTINATHSKKPYSIHYPTSSNNPVNINKGQEMGMFQMGSTVIVLLENKEIIWDPDLTTNKKVLMGQKLGSFNHSY